MLLKIETDQRTDERLINENLNFKFLLFLNDDDKTTREKNTLEKKKLQIVF
jgi:hypothetical protein